MSRKTYRLTNLVALITYVMVDGKEETIEFTGGYRTPVKVKGTYTTSDAKIQKAIESCGGYGNQFVLISTEVDKEEKKPDGTGNEPGNNEGGNPDGGFTEVPEVKNAQAAKEYLITNHKVSSSLLPNKAKILEVAQEHKVSFPNLPK